MKKLLFIGIFMLAIAVLAIALISSGTWSKISFEAVVQESATEENSITRLIVEKTNEYYSSSICALHISESTKITDENGGKLSVWDIQQGDMVRVTLKDSSVEGDPMYYPTVYEIRVIFESGH